MKGKPRYVKIDPHHPQALGVCDESDFVFNRKDLVKQMEWRGNRLVWTGFYKGKPFVDQPQEQLRSPAVKADPYPVKEPRLPQPDSDFYTLQENPVSQPQILTEQLNTFHWTSASPPLRDTGNPDGRPVEGVQALISKLNHILWGIG